MTRWAFHERGVLRVTNLHHSHAGKQEQPDWYRVTDDLQFGLDIHELVGGIWQPFRCVPWLACNSIYTLLKRGQC